LVHGARLTSNGLIASISCPSAGDCAAGGTTHHRIFAAITTQANMSSVRRSGTRNRRERTTTIGGRWKDGYPDAGIGQRDRCAWRAARQPACLLLRRPERRVVAFMRALK
jgi:hypothetical protein